MTKKKLGNKYVCYQCGCKFYDLSRPKPICPKCGADQSGAPARDPSSAPKAAISAVTVSRGRGRRRREEEDSLEPVAPFPEDEIEPVSPLEDGLSMIDDDEFMDDATEDFSEED
jgi:hypothetical protein